MYYLNVYSVIRYHCLKIVDLDSKCILNVISIFSGIELLITFNIHLLSKYHCLKIVDLDSKCILNVISNSIPVLLMKYLLSK